MCLAINYFQVRRFSFLFQFASILKFYSAAITEVLISKLTNNTQNLFNIEPPTEVNKL